MSNNNTPTMIAPIQIIKIGKRIQGIGLEKGAYFIGRKGFTDILNFIYDVFDKESAKRIIEYISEKYFVNHFFFEKLLDGTSLAAFLIEQYGASEKSQLSCAALKLPETKEEYLKSLKRHAKQNFRTAINRQIRDDLKISHEVVYEIDNDLQHILLDIREQRLKEKKDKSIKKVSSKLYNYARDHIILRFNAKHDVFSTDIPYWLFW